MTSLTPARARAGLAGLTSSGAWLPVLRQLPIPSPGSTLPGFPVALRPCLVTTAAPPSEPPPLPSPSQLPDAPKRKPLTIRGILWEQRHAWGNMAMLFSCGLLAVKVASQRREMNEAEAEWAAEEKRMSDHVGAVSAELDGLRGAIRQEVEAGTRNLPARITAALEESEKRSEGFKGFQLQARETKSPLALRASLFGSPKEQGTGPGKAPPNFMV